jgi:RecA-family ATPase
MSSTAPIVLAPKDLDSQLSIFNLSDFLSLKLPSRELLLEPWLPKAGLCMIHAYRGIGKTHISLGIAYALARGGKFLNWNAPQPRNVLYIDGEMPASVLQERLASIIIMSGEASIAGSLRIITPDLQASGMPDLATLEGQTVVNHYIADATDLVIVDNLSCLAPSIKENDASDWATFQTWVLSLRARGKSVLLIHHSGKSGGQRGTSKKEDVLDMVIALERPKDYESSQGARFVVRYEKSRGFYGDEARPFEAQLCCDEQGVERWQTQSLEESNYEKVITMTNDGASQKEIADDLQLNKSTISRYVKRASKEGRLKSLENKND